MISTLKKTIKLTYLAVLVLAVLFPLFTQAQVTQSLSVSPTLFEMSANPSQAWSSSLRIINSNNYELRLYADVVNFSPQGETGQPRFQPIIETETQGKTLAEWINIETGEIRVPPEQTIEIPFTILVPEDAQPGGHFAAILVGTRPNEENSNRNFVETSQIVTSLVFLRVAGDVIEDGSIRSFRTTKSVLDKPEATFELRFENKGNVHVQPRGEIEITNMWGQVRGVIPVNREVLFGNVLPDSVRKFDFTWTGEWSLADIGRYTAVATLAYGQDASQFDSREVSFWVIPWKILLIVLLVLGALISVITWLIKLYIRKMLSMAGVAADGSVTSRPYAHHSTKKFSVVSPIEAGILDLRNRFSESTGWGERFSGLLTFLLNYKLFFVGLVAIGSLLFMVIWYVQNASVSERGYEVVIDKVGADKDITISSEQLEYEELTNESSVNLTDQETKDNVPPLKIINRSGVNGLAAKLRLALESEGYEVSDLSTDFGATENNTVIVYAPEYAEVALELSRSIEGALLSAFAGASESDSPITVYVGQDYESDVQ